MAEVRSFFFFFDPSATVLERVSTCNLQLATCRPDPLGIGVAFEESGLTGLRFLERGGIAGFNVQMLAHGVEMWRQLELPRYLGIYLRQRGLVPQAVTLSMYCIQMQASIKLHESCMLD